jgi:hypothetical protein
MTLFAKLSVFSSNFLVHRTVKYISSSSMACRKVDINSILSKMSTEPEKSRPEHDDESNPEQQIQRSRMWQERRQPDKLRHIKYRETVKDLPVPGIMNLQVIGTGGRGTPRSVLLVTEHYRYGTHYRPSLLLVIVLSWNDYLGLGWYHINIKANPGLSWDWERAEMAIFFCKSLVVLPWLITLYATFLPKNIMIVKKFYGSLHFLHNQFLSDIAFILRTYLYQPYLLYFFFFSGTCLTVGKEPKGLLQNTGKFGSKSKIYKKLNTVLDSRLLRLWNHGGINYLNNTSLMKPSCPFAKI